VADGGEAFSFDDGVRAAFDDVQGRIRIGIRAAFSDPRAVESLRETICDAWERGELLERRIATAALAAACDAVLGEEGK
jgi:hypothetical protein